jgi:UDP-N-acetylmuramoyl-tripeptide--D-alanyl-D-alanine ligase
VVEHPLGALQGVAAWWRRRHGARVLAVAGAVGKTTTKELLANAVSRRFRTLRTPGNFNNELGLPITLLGLTPAHEVAVLEIGISEVGEMATFAAVAGADVAVMTRIVPEHMEFLRDLDTVEREEGVLIESLSATGVAVLNAGDPRVARMATRTRARVIRFGSGEGPGGAVGAAGADVWATAVRDHGLAGMTFTLHAPAIPGGPRAVRLPLMGRHFLTAALGAAGAAFAAGCGWTDVLAGLEQVPDTRRLAPRLLSGGVTLLDDAYNASPDSTRAALDVLAGLPGAGGRRLAVLGDMLELGDYAPVAHRDVGAHVPGRADVLITVGDLGREIARAAREAGVPPASVHECESAEDAVSLLLHLLRPGDTLLVKASHGMHLERVVEALEAPGP